MPNPPFGSESWSGPSPGAVRDAVIDALRAGASAVCVTGGIRSGKTALCQALAGGVDDRSFSTGVFDATLDPDGVLRQLLADFGLAAGGDGTAQTHQSLSAAVVRFLKSLKPLGAHALIVIDDADQVGVDVLTSLATIAREAGGDALRLVLVGQPALDARLIDAPLREFPGPDRRWTRITLPLDDALVPVIPPESPYVAAIEPEVDGAARVERPSRGMVPLLLGLLVVVAVGWWWASRGASPTPSAAPTDTPPTAATPALPARPAAASQDAAPPAANAVAPAGGSAAPTAARAPAGAPPAVPPSVAAGSATSAAPSGNAPYRITVASFRTATRAEQIAASLRAQQLTVATRADASGTWHQVIAGPYPSIESAREAQRLLERAGFPDTQITLLALAPR